MTQQLKRILITGGEGFVGKHLQRELVQSGHQVFITRRPGSTQSIGSDQVKSEELELPDKKRLLDILSQVCPQVVLHLAAVTFVPTTTRNPSQAVATNMEGTRALMECLDETDPARQCSVVMSSSAHVYQRPENEEPLDEESPLGPESIYGKTKLAAELVASCLSSNGSGDTRPLIIFRCFNHSGPGQDERFVISSFARHFAMAKMEDKSLSLEVGNLDVERDFSDVRDVVRAYRFAAEGQLEAGIYNLSSGTAVPLKTIIDILQDQIQKKMNVQSVERLRRPDEIRTLFGSCSKLYAACGWKAEIPLEKTVVDLFNWWHEKLAHKEKLLHE